MLCSRILHEATKGPISNVVYLPVLRLERSLGRLFPENCQDSAVFQQIAASGQVWLAQKLLETRPPTLVGTEDRKFWDEAKLAQDISSSIQTMPGGDTPPAILARIGLFAIYCEQLLTDREKLRQISRSSLPRSMVSYLQSLRKGASNIFLSTIDANLEETRQYKHASYAVICLQQGAAFTLDYAGKDRDEFAMTALMQTNLARLQQFQDLDLIFTWVLLRKNRDKLGWLRLLAILKPFSATAQKVVSACDSCEWGDDSLAEEINSELKRETSIPTQADQHSTLQHSTLQHPSVQHSTVLSMVLMAARVVAIAGLGNIGFGPAVLGLAGVAVLEFYRSRGPVVRDNGNGQVTFGDCEPDWSESRLSDTRSRRDDEDSKRESTCDARDNSHGP